jgi:quinol-cytochrome oxidoreductase complex cytochrome b subunit
MKKEHITYVALAVCTSLLVLSGSIASFYYLQKTQTATTSAKTLTVSKVPDKNTAVPSQANHSVVKTFLFGSPARIAVSSVSISLTVLGLVAAIAVCVILAIKEGEFVVQRDRVEAKVVGEIERGIEYVAENKGADSGSHGGSSSAEADQPDKLLNVMKEVPWFVYVLLLVIVVVTICAFLSLCFPNIFKGLFDSCNPCS